MDDKEIVQLYLQRNEAAITATSDKYGKYCFSLAWNILHNKEDTEECVNESYLKTWNSIPPNRPKILRAFVGRITRNTAISRYRRMNSQRRGAGQVPILLDELAECVPGGTEPDKEFEKKDLTRAINCFLSSLDKEKRAIMVSRYWYAASISEISRKYGLRENYVSVKLSRTRKKLYEYLLQNGFVE